MATFKTSQEDKKRETMISETRWSLQIARIEDVERGKEKSIDVTQGFFRSF